MKKYIAILCGISILAAGCGTTGNNEASTSANGGVTLKNCGDEVTYQHHDKLWVHDGSIISIALAAGAGDKINWVSSMQKDKDILRAKYGDIVDRLDEAAEKTPSLEEVVSKKPDIMVAGWNYGFSESNDLNPERLKSQGIDSYILTESCRQGSTDKRGVVEPWQAVRDDLGNLGKIAGSDTTVTQVIDDMDTRLDSLKAAQQAEKLAAVRRDMAARRGKNYNAAFSQPPLAHSYAENLHPIRCRLNRRARPVRPAKHPPRPAPRQRLRFRPMVLLPPARRGLPKLRHAL